MQVGNKISKITFLFLTVTFLGGETKTEAGILKIFNKSNNLMEINITFIPEGKPYCRKCLLKPQQIGEKETVKIIVPLNAFNGCEYFSIIDVSHGFLGNGKCKNLSVLKNYEIAFFETFFGTRCKSTEI